MFSLLFVQQNEAKMENQEHIPHRQHLLKGKRNTWAERANERFLLRKCYLVHYNKHFETDSKPVFYGTEIIPHFHCHLHTQLTLATPGSNLFPFTAILGSKTPKPALCWKDYTTFRNKAGMI